MKKNKKIKRGKGSDDPLMMGQSSEMGKSGKERGTIKGEIEKESMRHVRRKFMCVD